MPALRIFHQFRAGRAEEVGFEFFADADEGISQARAAVMRAETPDAEVSAHFVHLPGHHGDELERRALALDIAPAAQEPIDGLFSCRGSSTVPGFMP